MRRFDRYSHEDFEDLMNPDGSPMSKGIVIDVIPLENNGCIKQYSHSQPSADYWGDLNEDYSSSPAVRVIKDGKPCHEAVDRHRIIITDE